MKTPIFDELSPGYKLLFLFSFCLVGLIIFGTLSIQLASMVFDVDLANQKLSNVGPEKFSDYRHAHQLSTALNQLGVFALAALSFFQLTERESIRFSKVHVGITPFLGPVFALLGISAIFASFALNFWNLEIIEALGLRDQADQANKHYHTIQSIIMSGGQSSLLINILVIGILPGICEELFYRGGVLQYLLQLTNSKKLDKDGFGNLIDEDATNQETSEETTYVYHKKWLAIIISALMFAVMHMEWDGFLTRFAMGVLLGWVFVGTGSLLASMIVHAAYNTSGVILLYWQQNNPSSIPDWIEKTPAIGIAITGVIIFFLRKQFTYSRLSEE